MSLSYQHLGQTEKVAQVIEDMYARLAELFDKPNTHVSEARDLVTSIIEEARVSLEELRVADEEIGRQQQELDESYRVIAEERAFYQELFNAAPIGYVVTSRDGTIQEANRSASEMFGVHDQQLTGKRIALFVPGDDREQFNQKLNEAGASHTTQIWEARILPRGASGLREFEMTVAVVNPRHAEDKRQLRWLIQDVTDRKLAEAARLAHFFQQTFEQAAVGIGHLDREGRWLRINTALSDMLGYSRDELIGSPVRDFIHGAYRDAFGELLQGLIDNAVRTGANEYSFVHSTGAPAWVDLTMSSVRDERGEYEYAIAVLNDVTESRLLAIKEMQQRQVAEALGDIALTLNRSLEVDEVLDTILAIMAEVFPETSASVLVQEAERMRVVRSTASAAYSALRIEKALYTLKTADGSAVLDSVAKSMQPYIASFGPDDKTLAGLPDTEVVRSVAIIPIVAFDVCIGCLELHSPIPGLFIGQPEKVLSAFASHAAIAIHNAHRHQQAKALAIEDERQRLARELHDAVTQSLFSASIISESLLRRSKATDDPNQPHLQELSTLSRSALAEMRILLTELRPEHLLKSPLQAQIRQLVDAAKGRKSLYIDFEYTDGNLIPDDVHIALYRVAQEIFNNIVKHSQATDVRVRLHSAPDSVTITVHDNGVGFDPAAEYDGIGLNSMRERMKEIGGSFDIQSRSGHGTTVNARWERHTGRRS